MERQNLVVNMWKKIYEEEGYQVHVSVLKYSLLDKLKKRPKGDKFYVCKEGITIINRQVRKPIDIMIYKNGQLWSVFEVTNLSKKSWFPLYKFKKYVENLTDVTSLIGSNPHKFFIVSYPENFRNLFIEKSKEYNIKWAEKYLAKNKIFLIYWEMQHMLPELRGWIENE